MKLRAYHLLLPFIAVVIGWSMGRGDDEERDGNATQVKARSKLSAIVDSSGGEIGLADRGARLETMDLERLRALATAIASRHDDLSDEDLLVLDSLATRDPDVALSLAEKYWQKHPIGFHLLMSLTAKSAMQGAASVEELMAKMEDPGIILFGLVRWAPPLEFSALAPSVFEHVSVNSYNLGRNPLFSHFKNWAEIGGNPAAALAAAEASPEGMERRSAILGSIAGWAKSDPHAAAAWVKKQDQLWLTSFAGDIIERESSKAKHPDADTFKVRHPSQLPELKFESDQPLIDGPIAFAKAGIGAQANELRQKIVQRLAEEDPAAAAKLIASLPHGKARADLIRDFRIDFSDRRKSVEKLRALIMVLEDPIDIRIGSAALNRYGRFIFDKDDPAAQAEFLGSFENPRLVVGGFGTLATSWARSDLEAAQAWVESLPDGPARESASRGIISSLAWKDPEAALALAVAIENPKSRQASLKDVGYRRGLAAPADAVEWAGQQAVEHQATMMLGAVEGLENPIMDLEMASGFSAWLSSSPQFANDPSAALAAEKISEEWAKKPLADAAGWLDELPAGEVRDRATERLTEKLILRDAVEASQWIAELPEGSGRDASTAHLVRAIQRDDPDSALRWATSINDPDARLEHAAATIQHWSRFDSEGAWSAAEDTGLSADEMRLIAERLAE